jgi:C-terminal processing protease CtpA/Prc
VRILFCLVALLQPFAGALAQQALAQQAVTQKTANLESFEIVWRTVRDRPPDPKLNGLNWVAIHDQTKPRIAAAKSIDEVRDILREMLAKLDSSHYAIIPKDRYEPTTVVASPTSDASTVTRNEAATPAAPEPQPTAPVETPKTTPAVAPPPADKSDKMVSFGNLPEMHLTFESHALPDGAGYIKFNEFLDPVSIIPQFDAAMRTFAKAPGVILDLRGNPGGIGIMAMGIAGFFVDKEGQKLGEMKMRDATLKFVIFPRPETYDGPLAILVDAGSASTTEILAQGLRDLGRARIFGTRTAGAALPSDIVRLPNGDGFQFAQASYTSVKGTVLEGTGVTPDVEVRQTAEATRAGRDLVVEAADAWIHSRHQLVP